MNVKLPAVLGILAAEQPPRYVPVSRIRAAMKSTQFEELAAAAAGARAADRDPRLYPPAVGQPGRDARRLGSGSRRPHRRDPRRERTGEMSAQDVLVLAEIQRDALADITLELLAAARGAGRGRPAARSWPLVLGQDGARYAPALGAADRIVRGRRSAIGRLLARSPIWRRCEEVVAAEQPRAVLVGGTSIGWDLAPLLGRAARRAAGDRLQGDRGRRRARSRSPRPSAAAR